jgi:hypothetical protein
MAIAGYNPDKAPTTFAEMEKYQVRYFSTCRYGPGPFTAAHELFEKVWSRLALIAEASRWRSTRCTAGADSIAFRLMAAAFCASVVLVLSC